MSTPMSNDVGELATAAEVERQLRKLVDDGWAPNVWFAGQYRNVLTAAATALSSQAAEIAELRKALESENAAIADYLRYCAGHYPESSDGRNTFVMAASWVEARALTRKEG